MFRKKESIEIQSPVLSIETRKRRLYVTGSLLSPVKKNCQAVYIYNGNVIRTSTVQNILEASSEFISFETVNSLYTIEFNQVPVGDYKQYA